MAYEVVDIKGAADNDRVTGMVEVYERRGQHLRLCDMGVIGSYGYWGLQTPEFADVVAETGLWIGQRATVRIGENEYLFEAR